jgi:hypothetical protein
MDAESGGVLEQKKVIVPAPMADLIETIKTQFNLGHKFAVDALDLSVMFAYFLYAGILFPPARHKCAFPNAKRTSTLSQQIDLRDTSRRFVICSN